ncbi:MAG TPA: response regulator [Terracidiphilus sp.]|jgi:CheY-like chemotaxis protein|nr:response regulator [Terracidiphilus sp.]
MVETATNPRMLVVDDEHTIADTLAAIFRLRGFNAVAVYSGEAAVDEALAEAPAVLITDISMNGMNGVEAAIRVSRACPKCRILLFSGHPENGGLLARAREDGHEFEVLAKPVHPKDIFEWLEDKGIR